MLDNVIAIYKKLPVVIGVTICTLPLWLKHIMAHSFPFRYSEVNVASEAKEFLSTKTALNSWISKTFPPKPSKDSFSPQKRFWSKGPRSCWEACFIFSNWASCFSSPSLTLSSLDYLPSQGFFIISFEYCCQVINITSMSPQCHRNVTSMSPQCHRNITSMSPQCYLNVT